MKKISFAHSLSLKTLFISLLFGAVVFLFGSCGRCDGCWDRESIRFTNFTKAELDSVVIKQYAPGSDFTILKDSFTAVPSNYIDSVSYGLFYPFSGGMDTATGDILIYIPADSLTYRVTAISYAVTHCSKCPDIQLYNFSSYSVNGVRYTEPYIDYYGGYIQISK